MNVTCILMNTKIFCCCSAERDMVKTYGIGQRLLEKVGVADVLYYHSLLNIGAVRME